MQEETWASNANAFVAQEFDETQAYSVRVAGFDLLAVSSHLFTVSIESTCGLRFSASSNVRLQK
jgi:importin-9